MFAVAIPRAYRVGIGPVAESVNPNVYGRDVDMCEIQGGAAIESDVGRRLTASMAQRADGTYLSVRFGNVLGSRGSVLHTFTAQIAAGGPVTVVHPDVTRYFMTVEEAVQLVIQAGAIGEDGQVMILDMGEPVKILDFTKQLIDQSGKDIEVVYSGLREGEKLHEQLFGGAEDDARSKHLLVSHAEVEPLTVDVVRSYGLQGTHFGMFQAFEDWVHLPDPRRYGGSETHDQVRRAWQ